MIIGEGECGNWSWEHEKDEDGSGRIWIYNDGEPVGTYEGSDSDFPRRLVKQVESHIESLMDEEGEA